MLHFETWTSGVFSTSETGWKHLGNHLKPNFPYRYVGDASTGGDGEEGESVFVVCEAPRWDYWAIIINISLNDMGWVDSPLTCTG